MSLITAAPATRKLQNWDSKASVRVKPRRMLQEEEASGKLFFPPELAPVCQHPIVIALGPRAVREVQVRHLYRYLDFTSRLELEVINEAAKEIALDQVDVDLPDVLREDAFKLCTDEAHHAYFSDDIKRQVASVTGLEPDRKINPAFLAQLRTIQHRLDPGLVPLSELLFTVVSETLISGILARIPKDTRVVTAVRDIVADHAEDEGRHSAYFSQFFGILWPQLSRSQCKVLGPILPRFIRAFLQPDTAALRRELTRLPLDADQIETIIAESYPAREVERNLRAAATVTVRLFRNKGVLDDPKTADAFAACGLVLGDD